MNESKNPSSPQNTNICLHVKVDTLFNDPNNFDQDFVESVCRLSDNRTNPQPLPINDFTSEVNKFKMVVWETSMHLSGDYKYLDNDSFKHYSLEIIQIQKKKNEEKDFFDYTLMPGIKGKVTSLVRDNFTAGEEYCYNIVFSVTKSGTTKFFSIDPKLRGNN